MADKYVENILKLWNLECLIPNFREEKIDSEAFKYLDSSAISELIPSKDFKMMFKSKYEQYKTQVLAGENFDQTKSEEVDLTIVDVDYVKPKLELQSSSFDIEFILQESLAGRDVMNSYEAAGRLDYDISSSLVNILIYYLISQSDDFSIDNDVLNEIADAIVARFPTEKKERYYYCFGEETRGALVDCYHIVRQRLIRKERQKRKHTLNYQNSVDGDIDRNSEQERDNQTPVPEWVNVDGRADNEEMVNIKWASHRDSLLQGLPLLLAQEKFVDTTIVCESKSIKCHKVVLSSYSSYFDTILESSPSKHPVVVLADLEFWEVQAIINFIYKGELHIEEHRLPRLLESATKLKIKGLTDININNKHEQVINISETANVDQEVCNDQPVKDPLSVSPTASTRKKRKQNFTNLVEPVVSFPTITPKKKLKNKNKYFRSTEDTYYEDEHNIFTQDIPYKSRPVVCQANHRLQSIPGKKWRLCDVCTRRGWKRYARYWCVTCDLGVHQRCYYKRHKDAIITNNTKNKLT